MSTPNPIGAVHFNEPRALRVREPEDTTQSHSAVHSGVSVYVDTQKEAHAIIAAWPVIMQAAADKVEEILSAVRQPMEK